MISRPLILKQPQAEAVNSAMRALNNAGGRLYTASFDAFARGEALVDVRSFDDDRIEVRLASSKNVEIHADLSAFALAYGLPQSEAS